MTTLEQAPEFLRGRPEMEFGTFLHALRDTCIERVRMKHDDLMFLPDMKPSVVATIAKMNEVSIAQGLGGFSISPAEFSYIENNRAFPDTIRTFINLFSLAMQLSENDHYLLEEIAIYKTIRDSRLDLPFSGIAKTQEEFDAIYAQYQEIIQVANKLNTDRK